MTVEDGTGLEDADSYVSIEYADTYFASRGFDWSTLSNDEKCQLLIKATDYIDNIYEWYGIKKTQAQSLRFPRKNLRDIDGYEVSDIPVRLKQAVCEAVKILVDGSDLFVTASENGAVTSEKIGELSFSYDVSQKVKDETLYDAMNKRLRGLYKDKSKSQIFTGSIERS